MKSPLMTASSGPHDVPGCIPCDLLRGRRELPGGRIHETPHFVLVHALGAFGLGAIAVVPVRHVVRVGDLSDEESDSLGRVLRDTGIVVTKLTNPVQVYSCQWSHHGGEAAHIHFILQPIRAADMAAFPGLLGPDLQAAIRTVAPPALATVEDFAEKARSLFRGEITEQG
jgi:diadenosine tetraphosphate (Ap4A) HIT family hydrolase